MCTPDGCASSRMTRSAPTSSWRPPVCRCCSRRSRSTACRIGTAAISAIPSIFPLFSTTQTEDVLLIQINPLVRNTTPTIEPRHCEPAERDHVQFAADGRIARDRIRGTLDRSGPADARARARQISAHQHASHRARCLRQAAERRTAASTPTTISSRCCATNGKRAARRFLDAHFDDIGVRGTVDLQAEVKAEWA